jgi:hypothetical protein
MKRLELSVFLTCLFITALSFYSFRWRYIAGRVFTNKDKDQLLINIENNESAAAASPNRFIAETTTTTTTTTFPNSSISPLDVHPLSSSSSPSYNNSLQFQQLGCLKHETIHVKARGLEGQKQKVVVMEMKMRDGCGPLRRDWRNNPPLSQSSQMILQHQSNCTLPVLTWDMVYFSGIGSYTAHWSMAMCYAQEHQMRLASYNPSWPWLDQTHCDKKQAQRSPWLCYFPQMEYLCQGQQDVSLISQNSTIIIRRDKPCLRDEISGFLPDFRAATVEYIFRNVSPLVIQEAQRQIGVVFGPNGAPKNLITVHVRWGDKKREMKLVSIDKYVDAVWKILDTHQNTTEEGVNVYLATEDPAAAEAFTQAAPKNWTIFTDVAIEELTPFRPPSSRWHCASLMAQNTLGRGGLLSMGSLLVSMEANLFVLSTGSSFGRVINEIRTRIIDPRCGNCTRLIDVRPGQWI